MAKDYKDMTQAERLQRRDDTIRIKQTEMATIKVKLKDGGTVMTINEKDFDSELHEKIGKPRAKLTEDPPAEEPDGEDTKPEGEGDADAETEAPKKGGKGKGKKGGE